ncbi:enoyl-CoA hydratase/isomerase family protein [Stakelama marina]|uniref:Enoyl-CoA hydratase/isomerase family protein n=1 Tax=Stakelama marina TaxID=2826939 RepID=A0A8T4IB63_9SPHN|nr:enoyl-CoA hydratase-related protein [Stakelama marina]MBR0551653.1 enoyl-CoA hydratase/isomerase family protein [Stakelama marina]
MFRLTHEDGIATVAIDRPAARNAIGVADWKTLAELCAGIAASDAGVVMLTSAHDGIFSAGADISEFDELQSDAGARVAFRDAMRAGIDGIHALPVPVIAVIGGGCYGAAVALALAADIRIAGPDARFATTPAKLGLSYPREDVKRLEAAVGAGWAAHMLFSGEPVGGEQAEVIGLVQRVEPVPLAAARVLAGNIAANAPEAMRVLKRTLRGNGDDLDFAFDARFASEEFAERLSAFRNRKRGE